MVLICRCSCQDYKARLLRWEKAVAVWRQFHCDLKDVTSWMTNAEKVLEDTSGESEFNTAKKEQKVGLKKVFCHQL